MKHPSTAPVLKRWALLCLLALCLYALSACYMEPDRVVNPNNGLNVGEGGQTFDTVITPTPAVTPTPTPAPTKNEVDWANWDFGADTATNPPAVVQPTQGSLTIPTAAPGVVTVTTVPTKAPTVTKAPTSPTKAPASSTLQQGSKGDNVKKLQQRLKNLGYYTGSVDGVYGQGTVDAVRDFQANNRLSVDGKAGKRTQEVLYGSNAKKKTATSVTAKPSSGSKPSTTSKPSTSYTNGKTNIYLRLGSSGAQVKILQNRLIVLGYLSGTADGEYGATTETAVAAFQKRNGLDNDGVAGPTTLAKLYSSSAKKANGVAAHLGSLREGMNGDAVRSLQRNLRTLGYYNGSVDGDYGQGTMTAVAAFQRTVGLTEDGIAGKGTLNAIQNALTGGGSGGGSSGGGGSANPENYGRSASSNGYSSLSSTSGSRSNVTALQSALRATGYYSGSTDGSYGSGTESAVKAYQKAAGLRVTGIAGPSTQRLLYGGTGESGSYSKLKVGSSGSSVKKLQYALYELKYYDGNITGSFDNATENAVMMFQEVNGLFVDGIAGQDTQRKMFSSNAVPNQI